MTKAGLKQVLCLLLHRVRGPAHIAQWAISTERCHGSADSRGDLENSEMSGSRLGAAPNQASDRQPSIRETVALVDRLTDNSTRNPKCAACSPSTGSSASTSPTSETTSVASWATCSGQAGDVPGFDRRLFQNIRSRDNSSGQRE